MCHYCCVTTFHATCIVGTGQAPADKQFLRPIRLQIVLKLQKNLKSYCYTTFCFISFSVMLCALYTKSTHRHTTTNTFVSVVMFCH